MRRAKYARMNGFWLVSASMLMASSIAGLAETFTVKSTLIEDKKAVFATVESSASIAARIRISGTITQLSITEGSLVKAGETIALVGDPKLSLQIKATDAQIRAAEREIDNLKTDLDRVEKLLKRGSATKARRDQIQTQYDVASSRLEASKAQRAVILRQVEEGAVLAPQSGRVLDVPLTVGSVVMPGEAVAIIAKDNFILRLSLPERHARFLGKGDKVEVAGRGINCDDTCIRSGHIKKVYPQIISGRVQADASVDGLGDYFVGERVQVRVGAGDRKAILVPRSMVFTRYGVDFVRARSGSDGTLTDVAVQVGMAHKQDGKNMIEVLSGLDDGDQLVQP